MDIHGYPWDRRRRLILSAMLPATWWSSSSFSTRPVPVRNAARPWSPSSAARRQRSNSRVSFKKSMRFTLETEPEQAVDVHIAFICIYYIILASRVYLYIYLSLYLFISILKRAYVWMYVCVYCMVGVFYRLYLILSKLCALYSAVPVTQFKLSVYLVFSCRVGVARRVVSWGIVLRCVVSCRLLSICLSIRLSVSLSVYQSTCLSVYQSIYLSVCLPACLYACLSLLCVYIYVCVCFYVIYIYAGILYVCVYF